MANYIYTNDGLINVDELMHYGVPGMKWGRRKNISLDGSKKRAAEKARRQMISAKQNKRAKQKEFSKAYREGNKPKNWFGENANKVNSATEKAAQESFKADMQYKAKKKAYKVAKKMANIEAKEVKKKYRNEYMKGASLVGKLYAKYTGSHRYYADMMYDINNGAYKSSNATSKLAKKVSDAEAKAAAQKLLDKLKSRTTKR